MNIEAYCQYAYYVSLSEVFAFKGLAKLPILGGYMP